MSKNQVVFITTPITPSDIKSAGHTKIVILSPQDRDSDDGIYIRLQSRCENGTSHPGFDALIKSGRQYIVHIEVVEN